MHSRLDPVYIQSLEAYVRGKEALALQDSNFISSPTPEFRPSNSFASSTSSSISNQDQNLPVLYDHQRKYVNALSKQIPKDHDASNLGKAVNVTTASPSKELLLSGSAPPKTGLQKDLSTSSTLSTVSVSSLPGDHGTTSLSRSGSYKNSTVTVTAPTTIKLELEPQGPFRFQPPPAPSSMSDWDEVATDILYLVPFSSRSLDKSSSRFVGEGKGKAKSSVPPVGVLLVAYADGRIDVCLDLIKVEAVWMRPVCNMLRLSVSNLLTVYRARFLTRL